MQKRVWTRDDGRRREKKCRKGQKEREKGKKGEKKLQ
jgi:hypothetical protein